MRRTLLLTLTLAGGAIPAAGQRAAPLPIPTPRSVLGFDPGEDRKLADWPALVRYYQALARASDRIEYRELGRTTMGAPFVALVISSPPNLRRLEYFREINARLADPRRLRSNREALQSVHDGRLIVLITSGIHSDEVAGSLTPAALAYRLATDTSASVRAVLDQAIVWLIPSLNPDGVSILSRWYQRTLGTPAEGSDPPELYNRYVGHDDNRDWYAFTQAETQLTVDSVYGVWHPQVVLDLHQQGTAGPRLSLPPYVDPIEPNVDPLLVAGDNALGTAVAWSLLGAGKSGISTAALYDAWTPARAFQHYHGGIRILAEAASADLASPITVPFERLQAGRGVDPRQRSTNFPLPWRGGRWTLRDIIDYQTATAMALLDQATRSRDRWLGNFLSLGWRAVRGWDEWPYAYVIPRQRDSVALGTLIGILTRGQVEVRAAQQTFTAGGQRYPAGSYVVVLRQPYAAFARALLEPQHYPDRRAYPAGPPEPPYDVTAHTLPLLLGVTAVAVDDSLRVPLSAPVAVPTIKPSVPGFRPGEGPRIGLYRSYVAPIDEGWTRWIFDTWGVPYISLVDSVVRAGQLKQKYDVIVLPDAPPRDFTDGLPRRYPAPYPGGLGPEGVESLRQFVREGGTLVALNDASRFAVQALLLPVRNVLEGVPDEDFYAPGSIFRLELDPSHPIAAGVPSRTIAWFESGPAFDVLDSTTVRVVGRYPSDPEQVLLSGWVLHPDRVAGRAAIVEVQQGAGRVILFGFRPQYRGQAQATFPLFFNSLRTR